MKYAVIIVTYNRKELLKECLQHVLNQNEKFEEVIVVNNHSQDGTTEFLKSYVSDNKKCIKLINASKNLGGAGGFKVGMENISEGIDYVLLIDDDAILNYDFLKNIKLHHDDKILAYSGTVKTDGKIDTSHRRYLINDVFMLKKDVPLKRYDNEVFKYDLSTFCGLLVSKVLIDKIGFPKAEYFIWYDDTEYSLRLSKYTKILNVNSAIINHKTIINKEKKLSWKSYYGYRNQIDVGKNYSKIPKLYLLYRYSYHRVRQFLFLVKAICGNEYSHNCAELNAQVIKDSKQEKMGLSEVFYPGKKI